MVYGDPTLETWNQIIHDHACPMLLHIVKDVVVIFREAFFITWPVHSSVRPSVPSSIHGWHRTGKKTLA